MHILVLNCGSSSVKFQLIATDLDAIEANADRRLASGEIERVGGEALITYRTGGELPKRTTAAIRDHRQAVEHIIRWVTSGEAHVPEIQSVADIHAVGHRVVHGGEHFTHSTLIDDLVLHDIEACIELAPLHNPANLKGIMACRTVFGVGLPQVAVFDTAFHQTLPERAYLYALPYQVYRRHKVRRYGFHGTSFRYVNYRYRQMLGIEREQANLIVMHLGNGSSMCAIKGGDSQDTSMGFTPLEGLVMGSRAGDLDPAIVDYLSEKEGLTAREVETLLNKQSGLIGISGLTNDMRDLLDEAREHDDRRAKLAIEIFCYRVKKYIGAYLAALGGADAIAFTGGIGENAPDIRAKICEGLDWFGISLDPERNAKHIKRVEGKISSDGTRVAAYVIPTDEEMLIARDTVRCVLGVPQRY